MLNDVRQTFRFPRREPLLASAMLATLAVAIGSTTAIFSVLDAVIIRPLSFRNPDQLAYRTTNIQPIALLIADS